ncbi:MAG: lipocalin family protein [Pseudarcicella sp.]|nr:lipocalin family protein [Pseudarcicella sp.]
MNKLLTIFALTFTTLLFTHCGKTEEIELFSQNAIKNLSDSLVKEVNKVIVTNPSQTIVKEWKGEASKITAFNKISNSEKTAEVANTDGFINFKADSTVKGILYLYLTSPNFDTDINGTYSLNNNIVKIKSGDNILYFVYEITNSKLTLKSNKELFLKSLKESKESYNQIEIIEELYENMNITLNYK